MRSYIISFAKTKCIVLLLLLLLSLASVAHGSPTTTDATNRYITIPMTQWTELTTELTALNQDLLQCKNDMTKLRKPSAELLSQLETAEKKLLQLQKELQLQKKDLTQLSSEAAELKTLSGTLKQQIDKERRVRRRQLWQNRIWCLFGGVAIGYACSR